MGILLTALKAALDILVQVGGNPLVLLAVLFVAVVYVLAFVVKLAWAVSLWSEIIDVRNRVWLYFKADPVGLALLAFVASVNLTIGIIAVAVYVGLKTLNIKVG